jgi:hypothetical protein
MFHTRTKQLEKILFYVSWSSVIWKLIIWILFSHLRIRWFNWCLLLTFFNSHFLYLSYFSHAFFMLHLSCFNHHSYTCEVRKLQSWYLSSFAQSLVTSVPGSDILLSTQSSSTANVADQWLALLPHIQEVPVLILNPLAVHSYRYFS